MILRKKGFTQPFVKVDSHLRRAGFTLVELMIAVSLVGMIMLALSAVDMASRKFLKTSDYEAKVQNNISPVLEMIVKDISLASGQKSNPGINLVSSSQIRARVDRMYLPTPKTYSDDTWIEYNFASNQIQRKECSADINGAWTGSCAAPFTIASNVQACAFTRSIIPDPDTLKNPVKIILTARLLANGSPPTPTNPEVTLETSVFPLPSSMN